MIEHWAVWLRSRSSIADIMQRVGWKNVFAVAVVHMMIWYDMIWYDMIWYDMIWCNYDIYDMICMLTAVGLAPGGSSTVYIYTQTIHRTTQLTTNWEECGPCPFIMARNSSHFERVLWLYLCHDFPWRGGNISVNSSVLLVIVHRFITKLLFRALTGIISPELWFTPLSNRGRPVWYPHSWPVILDIASLTAVNIFAAFRRRNGSLGRLCFETSRRHETLAWSRDIKFKSL